MQTANHTTTTSPAQPMLDIYPAQLAELSIKQLAGLPAHQLVQAHDELNQLITWSAQIRAKLDAAIELRVGNAARHAMTTSGQSGEVCFDQDDLSVRFSQRLQIQWDQSSLRDFARRIAEAGDHVENFLDVQFSVDEVRYQSWRPSLQALVARARIEVLGMPTFDLALNSGTTGAFQAEVG